MNRQISQSHPLISQLVVSVLVTMTTQNSRPELDIQLPFDNLLTQTERGRFYTEITYVS